jgi:stage III sporulation protein AH
MVLKKQTVWLLTMLSLMVVLSAYYLFNSNPADMYDYTGEQDNWLESLGESDISTSFSNEDMNIFLSYREERDIARAQLTDEYEQMMSSDATAQVIAEYKAKLDKIEHLAEAELTLESLIKAEGFEEAVVVADLDRVSVVVKSDTLERKQVLSIINLVKQQLHVAGNQVRVSYK